MIRVARAALVASARELLGTPWHHQGRAPGLGLDCIGLPVCVARAHRIPHEDRTDYGRRPNPERFIAALAASLDWISLGDGKPADLLCFAIYGKPRHLGMISSYGLIHTHQGVGRVVEHVLEEPWLSRIHSAWRFRVEFI